MTGRVNIMHLNIGSLNNKIPELQVLMEPHNPDILCLGEVGMKPD